MKFRDYRNHFLMLREISFKKVCFHGTVSITLTQLGLFGFWKTSWIKSTKLSKDWPKIEFLLVILKSTIRINFSYLFDSLLIIVSGLVVKLVLIRFSRLYIPGKRILFLLIVLSVVKISMSERFLWPFVAIDY